MWFCGEANELTGRYLEIEAEEIYENIDDPSSLSILQRLRVWLSPKKRNNKPKREL
jgi:hypothetical protein